MPRHSSGITGWRTVVWAALLLLALAGSVRAQQALMCVDCSTYGVEVTPDGMTAAPRPINTSGFYVFTVKNTGNTADTYNLNCSGSMGLTCNSTNLAPLTLAAFASKTVKVHATAGATTGTGRIDLGATGQATGVWNAGSILVPVVHPAGPPVAELRLPNEDNLDRSLCLTLGAGEQAAWQCGDLMITHGMPGYSTMNRQRSLTLLYNSGQASPRPRVAAWVTNGGPTGPPNTVFAELRINGVARDTATYAGWGGPTAVTKQIVMSYDASTDSSGVYPFTLIFRNDYSSASHSDTVSGQVLVVNRSQSEFGAGWGLAGVERLMLAQPNGAILWVGGDGSAKVYAPAGTDRWIAPLGTYRDEIVYADSTYTRTLRHGVQVTFDQSGRQIRTRNRMNQQTFFTWAAGQLASVAVPPGGALATYTFTYVSGKLDRITDPGSRVLDATVTGGKLTSLQDPDNYSVSFFYASSQGPNLITARHNRRGRSSTYVYGNGNLLQQTNTPLRGGPPPSSTAVTNITAWNSQGASGSHTAPMSAGDTALSFTKVEGPRHLVADDASFWVNRWGAPTRIVAPLGLTTLIERTDPLFPTQVTRITYPNNQVVTMTYGARGNLIQVRDSVSGLTTRSTTYGPYGTGLAQDSPTMVVDSTDVADSAIITRYAYNSLGLTQQVTAPNGHVTRFAYNTSNQVKAVTELSVPVWNQALGTEATDSLHTGFAFNTLGNVTRDTSPMGRVRQYTRDNLQRVSDVYDPANHRVQYTYDPLNRVTAVTEHVSPTPLVTQTTYAIDVVASVTDPRGVTRNWTYDEGGRATGEQDDLLHTEIRFYNAVNQLDSVRQRVFEGQTGKMIRYTYDPAGRRTKMAWPARDYWPNGIVPADSVLYTYDAMGRMLTATTSGTVNGVGDTVTWPRKIQRTYTARGEILSEVQSRANGTAAYRHTYGYDRLGRRTWYVLGTPGNVTYSDSLTYTYGTTGELSSIRMRWRGATTATDSAVFKWDALGRRDTVRYSNAPHPTTIRFAYDADGALRLLCANDGSSPGYAHVLKVTYNNAVVDDDGLATSITTNPTATLGCQGNATLSYTQTNSYDGRHQLTSMNRGGGQWHTYAYDGSGNMIQDYQPVGSFGIDYVIPANHNQVERSVPSAGESTLYLYDANGSRSLECRSGCVPNPGYRKYYYDGLGRMVGTDELVPDGTAVYFPDYDPLGRMVQAPDGPIRFGYDGDNVVRTNPDSAANNWTFVHGPGLDDPVIAHFTGLNGPGTIQAQETVYFVTDGQGRQYGVGDATGHDRRTAGYFGAWGGKYAGGTQNATSFGADRSSPTSMQQLSFFRNRWYDQQTGRWTQEDPIGVAGGINLYQFNGNNPVSYMDPFGLCPECRWKAFKDALGLHRLPLFAQNRPSRIVVGVSGTIGNLTGGVTTGAVEGGGVGVSANSPSAGASVDIGVKFRTAAPGEPTGSVSAGVGKHTGVTVSNETVMINIGVSTPTASPVTVTKDVDLFPAQGSGPVPIEAKADVTRVCNIDC